MPGLIRAQKITNQGAKRWRLKVRSYREKTLHFTWINEAGSISVNKKYARLYLFCKKNTILGFAGDMRTSSIVEIRMLKMLLILVFALGILLPIEGSLSPLEEEDNVLHIGAIFPMMGEGGWQGGQVSFFLIIIVTFY